MDDTPSPKDLATADDCDLLHAIAEGRTQARQRMAQQQRRLGDLESELAHRIGHISQELARARKATLDTEAELMESRGELEATAKKLRLDERGLAQLRRECEANAEDLAYHRQRMQQKLAEIELKREELDQLEAELKSRRHRIAHQLKAQRQENQQFFERERAELDRRRVALGETELLARQLAEAQKRVAEIEQRPAADQRQAAAAAVDDLSDALADMKRRYELAMEDLREQKRQMAELQKQPAAGPRAAAVVDHGEKLDWEAQKKRMLAALEADVEEEDDERQAERLKIRDVISRTDSVIAAKDREIEELRELLSAQTANLGGVAIGASAVAEMLSGDEIVRSERERLQHLQREWEEKLRQAEIDLSVQRAKIARERAEIEERQRLWQAQQPEHDAGPAADLAKTSKPQRGRWLTRLGLKEDES